MGATKRALAYILMLALLAFPLLVYLNAQALSDWWQLRGYNPPQDVTKLSSEDTMTSYAQHVFYVNHPDIETDASQFRQDCNENEQTIVLGCYHSDQRGIFIYGVTDQRLAGVEQVTAAHEMLHAAYDRLSSKDKSYIDGLLEDYYNNHLQDQRIIDTIHSYQKTEPNDVVNEMHSVFGTEVQPLPAPLENYYKKYFSNRQMVASYAASYESEFTSREAEIQTDADQLSAMKTSIEQQKQALSSQLAKIDSDRAQLDALRSSGNTSQYNAGVASFNAEINSYNSGIDRLRQQVNRYNQLVDQYNSIAKELASLQKAIDTRSVPQTTQ